MTSIDRAADLQLVGGFDVDPAPDSTRLESAWRRALIEVKTAEAACDDADRVGDAAGIKAADAALNRRWDARDAIEQRALSTRADTVAGIAFKLRIARRFLESQRPQDERDNYNWDERLFLSALADAERLAAGGAS